MFIEVNPPEKEGRPYLVNLAQATKVVPQSLGNGCYVHFADEDRVTVPLTFDELKVRLFDAKLLDRLTY